MRVLAINDISCVGKCSLTVALPVVSACGVTCDVLPTALLSTHTGGFEGYTFRDLSDEIPAVLKHWESLGLTFDFIYSGYLGNVSQIETVREIKRRFLKRNGKFIVDPVMGDGGKLYAHFDFHFVEKMRVLCEEADFILPNVTLGGRKLSPFHRAPSRRENRRYLAFSAYLPYRHGRGRGRGKRRVLRGGKRRKPLRAPARQRFFSRGGRRIRRGVYGLFGEGKKQKKGNRTRGKFYDGSHFPHGKSGRRQPLRSAFRRGNFQFFKRTRGG